MLLVPSSRVRPWELHCHGYVGSPWSPVAVMNVRLKPWSIAMRFEKSKVHLSRTLGFQARP